jgi:hypothetical protein
MKVVLALVALFGSAAAFAPAQRTWTAPRTVVFGGGGKYEDMEWGLPQKLDVYEAWNPSTPRSPTNFNPFEKDDTGNNCDSSGYFPGEAKYKDPIRPDANFATMTAERENMEKVSANPKPGQPGPGNYQGFNKM